MKIRYTGPHDVVEVPSVDVVAIRGESVEVPDLTATNLLEQGTWEKVTTNAPAPVAAVTDNAKGDSKS